MARFDPINPKQNLPPTKQQGLVGMDNLNAETALAPWFVRDAENVTTTRDGALPARRDGYSEVYAGTDVHSAWGDDVFPWLLFVDNGAMYGLQAVDDAPTLMVTQVGGTPISYVRVNHQVLWTNGQQSGLIALDGEHFPWACEAVPGQPIVAPVSGLGGLYAGTYQVAVTFRDSLGREGGTPRAVMVDVPANGGIQLSGFPVPAHGSVTTIRVYCSGHNDTSLYHVRDIPVGTPSLLIGAALHTATLKTQFHEPLPAGHLLTYGHGRVWTMVENVLYWSEALRGAQSVLANSYTRFPARGAVLAAVGDGTPGAGVYVAAGKRTYWLGGGNGDPHQFSQVIAYHSGAVPGTLAWTSADTWGFDNKLPVPCWLALDGQFCVGLPGGQVQTFNGSIVAADNGEFGAAMFRDRDGKSQMVATVQSPQRSSFAITDRATGTVIRNGIEIE